jgi:hypothetical protein
MVTRAKQLNINPEKMAKKVKRVIARQRDILAQAVMPYSDIDGGVETAFDELYKAFDKFIEEMDVSTDWLNQEVGS